MHHSVSLLPDSTVFGLLFFDFCAAMKKLIATGSRKVVDKARKRLANASISGYIPGVLSGQISGTDALELGLRMLNESRASSALHIANLLLHEIDDLVDIYLVKARALLELEALGELKDLIPPLLQRAGTNVGVLTVSARYFYLIGDVKNALSALKKANELEPNNVATLLSIESCYRYTNRLDRAEKIMSRCLSISHRKRWTEPVALKQYSATLLRLAQYAQLDNEKFEDLNQMYGLAVEQKDLKLEVQSAYALARQYDKRKDREREIEFLMRANTSESKLLGMGGDLDGLCKTYEREIQLQKEFFAAASPDWAPKVRTTQRPIFILGLPRSGTTLVEQILGSHSQLGQTGESKGFLFALRQMMQSERVGWQDTSYPEFIDKLDTKSYQRMVNCFEYHQSALTDESVYVDKELSNTRYVGLMAVLFAGAKFVHMDRAPMDIFLSCFRNSIPGVPETSRLESIAEYYVYQKRLVGHWQRILGDRLMILNYQKLVANPEECIEALTSFLGLDYEPAMLSYHERKNVVRSLSVDQVRNQIYSTSIEKWRYYEEALEPALRVLQHHGIGVEGVSSL